MIYTFSENNVTVNKLEVICSKKNYEFLHLKNIPAWQILENKNHSKVHKIVIFGNINNYFYFILYLFMLFR